MHRVLIVDDSNVARLALRGIVERGSELMQVVGTAATSAEAREKAVALVPDLILMDVELGTDDGVRLCAELLGLIRTRIVIVTAVSPRDPALLFRSLAAGALDVLPKPSGAATAESERSRFVRALRALATVPLLKTARGQGASSESVASIGAVRTETSTVAAIPVRPEGPRFDRILIGVSTGGPPLLEQILRSVRAPVRAPILVVQHIAVGFGEGFARWLGGATGHDVRYCRGAMPIEPGVVYVANDQAHLHLVGPSYVRVGPSPRKRVATPSVDELFESAVVHTPRRTLAMLLTGMGSDGAVGLAALRAAGATTVAQEPRSCVVASMPESAIARSAATEILDPAGIVRLLDRVDVRSASTSHHG